MQEPKTLNDIFSITCAIERPAIMKYKRDGKWIDISVAEFRDTVRWLATALHDIGVGPGDRVAILAENRPEWTMSDFAALCASAVSVPVYPTLLGWQIKYIFNDSGSVVVVCSDAEQLEKVLEIRSTVPTLKSIIVCDPPSPLPEGVLTFQDVVAKGRKLEQANGTEWFDKSRTSRTPDDLATLVYTSGTTGDPKGAMLTHGNITSNVTTVRDIVPFKPGDVALSILPLSHILERMVDYIYYYKGGCVAYAENVLKVADNLAEVQPQFFAAVPRLFEKMRARIMDNVAAAPPVRQKIFHWALGVAAERLPYRVEVKPLPLGLKVKSAIADKLVFSKIIQRLGGRVKFVVSGGAPLSADLAAFFIGAGVEILEGYGLTETSPVIAVNRPDKRRIGTVGPVIPGVEVKIAEDGEILSRGPHIMKGYWNNPEATAQAIDSDGWFHTGDIGHLDADGFLTITDRKKDIIITAYGKNIAPQPIEALLKSSPLIGTPVLLGDRRRYLTALIVPNFEKLERDAAAKGIDTSSREELVKDPGVIAMFQDEIDRFNKNLDRQEKVRRFALIHRDFSIEEDEITPSLKVKRKNIDQKYKPMIDEMYADELEGTSL
jgi:long-chain acyl-CoA synthetase